MSSSELTEWLAYAQIEPFGGPVDDMRAGLGPAMLLNTKRKEGADPVSPLAFYPWHDDRKETPETPEVRAERIAALLNAKANHAR